jgi:probable HAF family extracellular repeat protein
MRRPAAAFTIALALGATIIVPGADAQGPTANTARYKFTTIDVPFPGVGETAANGINDRRQISGLYVDSTGSHGFIDDRGRFSTIDVPFPDATGTELHGINNRGQIVGLYTTSGGQEHGFLDDRGVFSAVVAPFPGTDQTLTFGINNEGQIVGGYHNGSGFHGFVDDKGRFRPIDVPFPGASETEAFGINDRDKCESMDGTIEMSADDARYLIRAGWTKLAEWTRDEAA